MAVGVGDAPPPQQKISIESVGAVGIVAACQPDAAVPSVSVGKLRRAVANGGPIAQVLVTGS